jgi:hypothetical protein
MEVALFVRLVVLHGLLHHPALKFVQPGMELQLHKLAISQMLAHGLHCVQ